MVLALGASLLALGRWITSRRMAREGVFRHLPELMGEDDSLSTQLRSPFALLILLAAGVLLYALRGAAPRPALQWTWQPLTVAGSLLDWQMDSWNWLASAADHPGDRDRAVARR